MSAWVSFEEIKKAVSLEMAIGHYGIELRKVGPATLGGKCPLPMHGSDHKNRASFTATLTKGVGGVWACQSSSCIAARGGKKGGNTLDFVAIMEGCSIRDAAVKLAEWFGVPTTRVSDTIPKREPDKPAQRVSKGESGGAGESELNKPLTFTLQKIDHAHPYLKERGVTEETAQMFGVGVFGGKGSMQGRCVIPIHSGKGELVAYAGRAIDGSEPKYKFPAGFHKSLELYNLHRINPIEETVCVVEGFFDCMRVSEAGFSCVALMGSAMSEAQEELLVRSFSVVNLLLDGDEAGQQATADCLTRLGRNIWVRAHVLASGQQPDMLSVEEIRALLEH